MLYAAVHSTTALPRQLLNVHLTAAASIIANPPDYQSTGFSDCNTEAAAREAAPATRELPQRHTAATTRKNY